MLSCTDLEYKAGSFHLEDFSLELKQGDYCALLGPSGSGKTVILEPVSYTHLTLPTISSV